MSEKLDGVRAVWDGQVLRFRSGRVIVAPAWFLLALPKLALDGELWIGRGTFDRLSGVVRQSEPDDMAWREVKYLVFDAPGHAAPFAERVRFVATALAQANLPWLLLVAQRNQLAMSFASQDQSSATNHQSRCHHRPAHLVSSRQQVAPWQ